MKGQSWVMLMMAIGAILVIVYKLQNSVYVYQGPVYKQNFHPYIQTLTMFFGQMLSLLIFYLLKVRKPSLYKHKQQQAEKQGKILQINKLLLLVPSIFDLLTSTMQFFALRFISASGYQMLKGGTIVTTFILSVLFLKQPVFKNQLIGSLLALFGILIVGLANTVFNGSSSETGSGAMEILGYLLMVCSLFTNGMFFVFQQKLLNTYHLEPLEIVGYEGLYGFLMYIVLVPILCYVPCSLGPDACVYSAQGSAYMQGWGVYVQQLSDQPILILVGIATILGILSFNVAGVTVTKQINALARAIALMTKTIFVWIMSFIVTVTFGAIYPNYIWQKTDGLVIGLQIVGFLFMAVGNLIYVKIIKLGKDKNVQILEDPDNQSQSLLGQDESK